MWARASFAIRRFLLDLGGHLGSWKLSIVLMAWAALYYLFLAIWARSSPAHVVQGIAFLLPYWLVYGLLLVNTAVCLWRRLPALRLDLGLRPRFQDRPPEWQVWAGVPATAGEARARLARAGYRLIDEREGALTGLARRFAALGTFLFHGAFFLIAAGFLATVLARQEAKVWVTVGEGFEGRPDQYLSQSAPRALASGVPAPGFRVKDIRPELWRDQLLFTRLEADLELADGTSATTRINRPLWMGAATFLRLSGFGYAPRYELRAANGLLIDSAIVKLNLFPPGARDYFVPPNFPHRLYVEVFPDHATDQGQPVTRSMNLVRPAVGVLAYRGRLEVARAVLPQGETAAFEGLLLRFPEILYWGEFTIVFDPGAPVVFLGFLVGLTGLVLKARGGRAEVEWRASSDTVPAEWRGWGGAPPRALAGPAASEGERA